MSDAVVVAIIGMAQAVLLAVLVPVLGFVLQRLGRVRRDVAAVKHEVKNDHSTNLRVEADERHSENSQKLDYLVGAVAWLIEGWRANRQDITELQEHTGQPHTRRARRLAQSRPPIQYTEIPPGGTQ